MKNIQDQDIGEIDYVNSVNYLGSVRMIQNVIPLMEKGSGHIVNISSAMDMIQGIKLSDYCATKSALSMLTHTLRLEMKYRNLPIVVTLVCPFMLTTAVSWGQ